MLSLGVMSESSYSGFFICIEGIDGSGKTTHARMLVKNLCSLGYDAVYTTEPTKYSIPGRKLRESFFAPERLPVEEEFRLFLEDRIIHLKDEVLPQLKQGKIVVTDRYYHSSVAYQGSRGLDWKYILEENLKVAIKPNIVILLDIEVNEAIERIAADRNEGINTFERKENLQKVKKIYLHLADEDSYSIFVIKGSKPIPTVQDEIKDLILSRYNKPN
jgi:dTMP kinase